MDDTRRKERERQATDGTDDETTKEYGLSLNDPKQQKKWRPAEENRPRVTGQGEDKEEASVAESLS